MALVARDNESATGTHAVFELGTRSLIVSSNTTVLTKRDGSVSYTNLTVQVDLQNKFCLDAKAGSRIVSTGIKIHDSMLAKQTDERLKRDYTDYNYAYSGGGGIKCSHCTIHTEHHLTEPSDWDCIWSAASRNGPSMANYYYSDVGGIDLNGHTQGGRRVLMSTGQQVEDNSIYFGNNFETCDYHAFYGVAR